MLAPKAQPQAALPEFLEDLSYWAETERRTAKRLLELVKAALRDPFKGIGSPEPL